MKTFPNVLQVLAVAGLLAGCSVGPDYQRPDTPAPAQWSEQTAPAEQPGLTWWQSFNHPRLDQLMGTALDGNFTLAAASARVRQADAQLRIASSSLFPTISLGSSATHLQEQNLSTGKQFHYNTYSLLPGASYELDFWGKNRDSQALAQANLEASRFNQQTTRLTVQASVANTYFTILALQERLAVARGNLDNATLVLQAFQARAEVGTASALDVAQQESVVAEQRAALPPLIQQLRQNTYALATLTGALPEKLVLENLPLSTRSLPVVGAGLPSQLLTRRPDVAMAEAQLIAANANLKYSIASVYPSFGLTAQGGGQSSNLSNMFGPAGLLYTLGASITQPIFKGGALQGGIDLAHAQIDELAANYQQAVIAAFQDVEGALAAVEQTAQQEQAQTGAVATAQRAYDIVQAQLASGTVDITTLLNVQRTLFQAQDTLTQVKLAHLQALIGLFRALGGGWTADS